MLRAVATAACLFVLTAAHGASAADVAEATDFDAFKAQFCAAGADGEYIFVLPTSVFTEESAIACDSGTSHIRSAESADDPGHLVMNIDPPEGSENGLDCDGKADIGMTMVAINCLPASMEAADHPKN